MLLWVGLGNPEPGMARQRHNIGFMAIDVITRRHGFSPWRQRFKGMVAEGVVGGEKILALRPLTYMNLSGESVQAAAGVLPGIMGCAAWTRCWAPRITGGCGWGSAIRAIRIA
jgi:peptidyl-tRNA hydrolase